MSYFKCFAGLDKNALIDYTDSCYYGCDREVVHSLRMCREGSVGARSRDAGMEVALELRSERSMTQ